MQEQDPYDIVIEVMTAALNECSRRRVCKADLVPALADFVTAVGLHIFGEELGEECVRAIIERMESRIDDWHLGDFPVQKCPASIQ